MANWRHVPGVENPADIATRKADPSVLSFPNLWTTGPSWLPTPSEWPVQPSEYECDAQEVKVLCVEASASASAPDEHFHKQFSSLRMLLKFAAWIRRFAFNCVANRYANAPQFGPTAPNGSVLLDAARQGAGKHSGPLTFGEIDEARLGLIRSVQWSFYPDEMESLSREGEVSKKSSIRKLHPAIDALTGLMVATPRTGEPPLVIVAEGSHLAKLIVWDTHHLLMHAGVDRVICKIQQRYWIPKLRRLVRSQLGKCVTCQRHHGRPYAHFEGALAPFRGTWSKPFEHTGLDFAGPLRISEGKELQILIFTCASTRAVHLELTPDLSYESASLALRRFMGRRGSPTCFYSDNAPTFIKLSRQISLPWKFIPARAPWWGGWWETLGGVVKSSLRKSLHLSMLSEDQLRSVIAELEGVINERPLTYVSDIEDSLPALTPAHFFSMRLPLGDPWLASATQLRGAYKKWVIVSNRLIDRWRKDYLASLRVWRNTDSPGRLPKKGDIVLVREGPRRSRWPIAAIHDLISEHVAVVRLNGHLTRRATKLLYPLEADPPWEGSPRLVDPPSQSDDQSTDSSCDQPVQSVSDGANAAPEVPIRFDRRGRAIRLPVRFLD